jgi:hypothetical protein
MQYQGYQRPECQDATGTADDEKQVADHIFLPSRTIFPQMTQR